MTIEPSWSGTIRCEGTLRGVERTLNIDRSPRLMRKNMVNSLRFGKCVDCRKNVRVDASRCSADRATCLNFPERLEAQS